jgi:uroporphyrinogen III methyltransferase/synthase
LREAAQTLVIFMGAKRLKEVCAELMAAGFGPATPAALISRGTWPRQTTIVAPLSKLGAKAAAAGAAAPALVIVGEVVRLKKELDWYERQPLFGRRIIITRARSQASQFREQLTALGAEAIELPTIEIRPPRSYKELDQAIRDMRRYDWVVFTSVNGVDLFFDRLKKHHRLDARHLSGCRVAAVGEATRESLSRHGLEPDLMPKIYTTEALAEALAGKNISKKNILLIRPRIAPPKFFDRLKTTGASVTQATGYETISPAREIRNIHRAITARGADAIVFTSSSTARHLSEALGKRAFIKFVRPLKIYSIGPETSRELKRLGARVYRQSDTATIAGLIRTLETAP